MRSPVYLAIKKCSETRKSRSIYGAAIQIRTGVHVPRSRLRGSPERPRIEMRFAQGMRSPVLPTVKENLQNPKALKVSGAAIQIRTGVHVPRSRLRGSPERPRIEMRFAQGMRSPVLPTVKENLQNPKALKVSGAAIQIRTGVHVPRSRLRGSPERPRIEMRFAQGMRSPVLPTVKENLQNPKALKVSGAAIQIRTGVHVPRSRLRGSPERPRIEMRFAQGMRSPVLPTVKENLQNPKALKVSGAAIQIRTGDLILTKDALYLLSYSSIS